LNSPVDCWSSEVQFLAANWPVVLLDNLEATT
jgi:hypothetical protein